MEYGGNTKCRTLFIVMDSHAKMQGINESSYDWYSAVNKLLWPKYVDNSKRRLHLHQSMVTLKRTEDNLFVRSGKSKKNLRYC